MDILIYGVVVWLLVIILLIILHKIRCNKKVHHIKLYESRFYICNSFINDLEWSMSYDCNQQVISIGCKTKSKEEWDWFFGEHCTVRYHNHRRSPEFKKIKRDYYQFIKQINRYERKRK